MFFKCFPLLCTMFSIISDSSLARIRSCFFSVSLINLYMSFFLQHIPFLSLSLFDFLKEFFLFPAYVKTNVNVRCHSICVLTFVCLAIIAYMQLIIKPSVNFHSNTMSEQLSRLLNIYIWFIPSIIITVWYQMLSIFIQVQCSFVSKLKQHL